jgi:hypothetical protein
MHTTARSSFKKLKVVVSGEWELWDGEAISNMILFGNKLLWFECDPKVHILQTKPNAMC